MELTGMACVPYRTIASFTSFSVASKTSSSVDTESLSKFITFIRVGNCIVAFRVIHRGRQLTVGSKVTGPILVFRQATIADMHDFRRRLDNALDTYASMITKVITIVTELSTNIAIDSRESTFAFAVRLVVNLNGVTVLIQGLAVHDKGVIIHQVIS